MYVKIVRKCPVLLRHTVCKYSKEYPGLLEHTICHVNLVIEDGYI